MAGRLEGRRAVVTEADDFMGPAVVELFREEGAAVFEHRSDLVGHVIDTERDNVASSSPALAGEERGPPSPCEVG